MQLTAEICLCKLAGVTAARELRAGVAPRPFVPAGVERDGAGVRGRAEPVESLINRGAVAVVALSLDEGAQVGKLVVKREPRLHVAPLCQPPEAACARGASEGVRGHMGGGGQKLNSMNA